MNIRELIRAYLGASRRAVELLARAYGCNEIELASGDRRIPRRGKVGDVEFTFHGAGLYVELPESPVDLDFGPNGRFDGFDAWRLSLFAENAPQVYPGLDDQHKVQALLDELLEKGEIVHPKTEPSPHLYYLRDG